MNQETPVRVRFAPSPTGYLHIGNLRAGLFNWLYARHNQGSFLVRIEDTDQERSKQEYVDAIINSLRWMGIESDEPLVFQSQRLAAYQEILEQLIKTGHAYRCFCTQEDLLKRCKKITKPEDGVGQVCDDLFIGYDGHCRDRVCTDQDLKKPFVIRFALPKDQRELSFDDIIRGRVSVSLDQFDDFIIARSACPTELVELECPDKQRQNGWPIYNFVVVVDDAFMRITHVIRGEDHITNTFKQILLYQACGYQLPAFAHLSLVLGPSGDKLSKRDGATAVPEYQRMGFLPDALFNYLIRLGWAHGDQEVFSRQELIQYFSLDAVGKKGAIFDIQKLTWLNGVYIRQTSDQELLDRMVCDVMPDLCKKLSSWDRLTVLGIIGLYKDRVKTLQELAQELVLLHDGPTEYATSDLAHWVTSETAEQLVHLMEALENVHDFTLEPIQSAVKETAAALGIKLVALAQPLRIALLGKSTSPGIFELLAILGKSESLSRMQALVHFLKKGN
jgi:glutamyl-tRNA synthetase